MVHKNSKKGEVRLIIELNFRAEFEMARASEEYNRLVRRLPEIFVGKVEKLQGVIKVICGAAKKCMKEKKMHLGPWRKQRYMQAKWLSACERTMSMPLVSVVGYSSGRLSKPRASMLTVDFLDKLPNRTAVEVVWIIVTIIYNLIVELSFFFFCLGHCSSFVFLSFFFLVVNFDAAYV